ncbi:NAD(P)H-binding protein [Rubrivivax sp. RP6-9]|uniref:NAD(P)H-binding protein n=1 Tax=Rubrivivax sp. RP6-9 TaxID=3415750 RepID=UPI003CC6202B
MSGFSVTGLPPDVRIAIVGAHGAVGRATVRQFRQWGVDRLKLGVRRARPEHDEPWTEGDSVHVVDATDPASLRVFLEDVDCVVNCTGPAGRIGTTVIEAALAQGVHAVDVNGSRAALGRLQPSHAEVRGVLACGMTPGLSAALPMWAAQLAVSAGMEVGGLLLLMGGRDPIGHTAALDIVQAARERRSRASPGPAAADGKDGVVLLPDAAAVESFDSSMETLASYDDEELQDLRRLLPGCRIAAWAVHAGPASRRAMVQAALSDADLRQAAHRVVAASEADCAGRSRFQQLLVDVLVRDQQGHRPASRLLVRATDASALTAAALAVATRAVVTGRTPPGKHLGAEVLSTRQSVEELAGCRGVLDVVFGAHTMGADAAVDEGVL